MCASVHTLECNLPQTGLDPPPPTLWARPPTHWARPKRTTNRVPARNFLFYHFMFFIVCLPWVKSLVVLLSLSGRQKHDFFCLTGLRQGTGTRHAFSVIRGWNHFWIPSCRWLDNAFNLDSFLHWRRTTGRQWQLHPSFVGCPKRDGTQKWFHPRKSGHVHLRPSLASLLKTRLFSANQGGKAKLPQFLCPKTNKQKTLHTKLCCDYRRVLFGWQ